MVHPVVAVTKEGARSSSAIRRRASSSSAGSHPLYTLLEVQERVDENWIVLNGHLYDVTGLFDRHPTGPAGIEAFLHDDASRLFPRLPPAVLPDYCINPHKFENNAELLSTVPVCSDFTGEDLKNGLPCHDFVAGINATAKYMGKFEKGVHAHNEQELLDSAFTFWVTIKDRVYNVTEYVNSIRNEQTKQIEEDHPLAYLEQKLNNLVINKLNQDASELFASLFPNDKLLGCMDELFFVGVTDRFADVGFADRDDPDAPSSAFFDGGGGLGDGDLFSSLLAGFADDPVMEGVVGGFEACGIDVADMTSKALPAFFATPGIADADFTSPGALADPAASLGLVAPILLALRDDDEGDCGEDDSSLIQAAFEGYLQCSGINEILDPLDPVDVVSLSQNLMELCTPFLDLVANMDPTLDVGEGSDFEREGTRCLQSLLGDNPFGNLIRYEYDHLDKVLGCLGKLGADLPHCVFPVPLEDGETLSLPLSLDKKMMCVLGSSSKILLETFCVHSYDGLDKCLPQIDDVVDVDEYTSRCAQDEGLFLGKQEFLGIDSSVVSGDKIPDFCSKVFEERGLDTEELQSRLDYYNENREYGWTVIEPNPKDTVVIEEQYRSNPQDQDQSYSPEISHVESLPAKDGTFPFVAAGLIVSGGVLLLALIARRYIAGRQDPQKNYAHVNAPIDTIDDGEIA